MICDECGLFENPDNMDCCRVCFSVRRGIPLDDMPREEFDSFRHRMLKEERKKQAEENRKTERLKREQSSAMAAWQRVKEAEARGDYAGELEGCSKCRAIINKSIGYCVPCANRDREKLKKAGIPLPSRPV